MYAVPEHRAGKAMGRVEIKIPLVTWRDGRPRFIPGAAARALGYQGEDLRHPPLDRRGRRVGPWFNLQEAIDWSAARVAEIADKRSSIEAGETTAKKAKAAIARARRAGLVTVGQLVESFLDPVKNPRMAGRPIVDGKKKRPALAANTVRFYRTSARCLENFDDGYVWQELAVHISGKALSGILNDIEVKHGLAQARAVRAMLSAAYGFGRGSPRNWVSHNPVGDLEQTLPVLEHDVRPATVEEFVTFIAGCDALGFPDLGDVVCAGPWTGQRQNDRLALMESQITDDGILFEPHKKQRRRERILIPVAQMLNARLQAARERRRDWKVEPFRKNDRPVFYCDATKQPWKADWYRKVFRVVKHAVAFGTLETNEKGLVTREATMLLGNVDITARLAAAGIKPLASLDEVSDKHLRDTCLSWLPLAQANKFEIAGFSGHAFGQDDKILKHYVAIPPEFARSGMVKLEAWFAAKLAELEGRKQKEAGR